MNKSAPAGKAVKTGGGSTLRAGCLVILFTLLHGTVSALAAEIKQLSFSVPDKLELADVYYVPQSSRDVRAVLVLCPGDNGNGRLLLEKSVWQEYAKTNRLGLMGLHFVSDQKLLQADSGYYRVERGSGAIVIDAARKLFGPEKRLLLYGFSGGAHFTSNFINWAPDRVIGWCAYSAAWWDPPVNTGIASPPGIVVCGVKDAIREDESYTYFKNCRLKGQRVTWISLTQTAHELSPPLEIFVRSYFSELLLDEKTGGVWYDVDKLQPVGREIAEKWPSLSVWLPSHRIASQWGLLHSTD